MEGWRGRPGCRRSRRVLQTTLPSPLPSLRLSWEGAWPPPLRPHRCCPLRMTRPSSPVWALLSTWAIAWVTALPFPWPWQEAHHCHRCHRLSRHCRQSRPSLRLPLLSISLLVRPSETTWETPLPSPSPWRGGCRHLSRRLSCRCRPSFSLQLWPLPSALREGNRHCRHRCSTPASSSLQAWLSLSALPAASHHCHRRCCSPPSSQVSSSGQPWGISSGSSSGRPWPLPSQGARRRWSHLSRPSRCLQASWEGLSLQAGQVWATAWARASPSLLPWQGGCRPQSSHPQMNSLQPSPFLLEGGPCPSLVRPSALQEGNRRCRHCHSTRERDAWRPWPWEHRPSSEEGSHPSCRRRRRSSLQPSFWRQLPVSSSETRLETSLGRPWASWQEERRRRWSHRCLTPRASSSSTSPSPPWRHQHCSS
mmetsp:Transcript_3360/g.6949  ORF Transcript_3360/g.6949 Transcript_3360/m.6949 type:complete len:422 (-) Transcript_3360:263-1528(-)